MGKYAGNRKGTGRCSSGESPMINTGKMPKADIGGKKSSTTTSAAPVKTFGKKG